jgi:hypothetical protein
MNGESGLTYTFGTHRNKVFWLVFIILGAVLVSGIVTSVFYIDVLMGLFLVIIGLYKIGEEFITDNLKGEQQRVSEDMDNVMEWLTHSYEFTKRMKDTHENRLHHLDHKRADMDKKIEKNYREIVRKIIEVENRLNKTSKGLIREKNLIDRIDKLANLLVRERRMIEGKIFDVSERQMKAIGMVRKNGTVTLKDYMQKFRVRENTAQAEIRELVKKGFLNRRGSGREVHYVLGF